MEALSLYTEAFRMILKLKKTASVPGNDIFETFDQLHNFLLCAACRKLCIVPYKRHTAYCSHNVCKGCIGANLRNPCSWCYFEKNFDENNGLRHLLQSYKSMCKFIWSSDIIAKSDLFIVQVFEWVSKISDGAMLDDNFHYTGTPEIVPQNYVLLPPRDPPRHKPPLYRLRLSSKAYPKVLLKKIPYQRRCRHIKGVVPKVLLKKIPYQRRCRCGTAPGFPRDGSCSGETCPCYVAGSSCINCRCIECKNPLEYRVCKKSVKPIYVESTTLHVQHLATPQE